MISAPDFRVLDAPLDQINLIEASAGTGKTWNICGLYVRLLIEKKLEVGQILVVTFTNAAAAELRERIRSRLLDCHQEVVSPTPGADPLVRDLVHRFLDLGHDRARLAVTLDLALQSFDEASIFTIHGFCQRALSETAFDNGQALDTQLLADDEDLIRDVVLDEWRRHLGSGTLSPLLARQLLRQSWTTGRCMAWARQCLGRPLAQWVTLPHSGAATDLSANALQEACARAIRIWHDNQTGILDLLTEADALFKKNSHGAGKRAEAVRRWQDCVRGGDATTLLERDRAALRLSASQLLDGTLKANKDQCPQHSFFDALNDCAVQVQSLQVRLDQARQWLWQDMVSTVVDRVRQHKRDLHLVAYDDMLYNLYQGLHHPDRGRALIASLRRRFPAALIDEFQDTDPLQWASFHTLYAQDHTTLFLVGDPKQAIYRFRHADLHSYLKARQAANRCYTLRCNQRSTPAMVQAINALFGAHPNSFLLADLHYPPALAGQRTHAVLSDAGADPPALQLWGLPSLTDNPDLTKENARQLAAAACAAEVARLIRGGQDQRVTLGHRSLQPADICLLVRTHEQASLLRLALSKLRIASIEQSRESIFQTPDAADLQHILQAAAAPAHASLVRTAMATPLFGLDAKAIAELHDSDLAMNARLEQFSRYHTLWTQQNVGIMLRQLLDDASAEARLLTQSDGPRRLTNLRHLMELLQQHQILHSGPDALLRWLESQRRRTDVDQDARQLRLESDQNLVQIVTIHKSKGLEFPVVFCPFIWEGESRANAGQDLPAYHDANGNAVIELRDLDDATRTRIGAQLKHENRAENLRLLYVALTRAVQRLYVVTGCYVSGNPRSAKNSLQSALHWLLAGPVGESDDADPDAMRLRWQALATAHPGQIRFDELPRGNGVAVDTTTSVGQALVMPTPPATVSPSWHNGSFSGMTAGARSEWQAADHDLWIHTMAATPIPDHVPAHDILRFPRGAAEGTCLHTVFEQIDFVRADTWPAVIASAIDSLPLSDRRGNDTHPTMVQHMLADVLSTSLTPHGLRLDQIPRTRRASEMAFRMPAKHLNAAGLDAILRVHEPDMPVMRFRDLHGFLAGVVDLVFEHDGRYYVLDWKSNHLGYTPDDYNHTALDQQMQQHGYLLQLLMYTLATHRHLQQRVPGYHYDTHFGEVLYLFVRGVRPQWRNPDGSPTGVYRYRLSHQTLMALDAVFPPDQENV